MCVKRPSFLAFFFVLFLFPLSPSQSWAESVSLVGWAYDEWEPMEFSEEYAEIYQNAYPGGISLRELVILTGYAGDLTGYTRQRVSETPGLMEAVIQKISTANSLIYGDGAAITDGELWLLEFRFGGRDFMVLVWFGRTLLGDTSYIMKGWRR